MQTGETLTKGAGSGAKRRRDPSARPSPVVLLRSVEDVPISQEELRLIDAYLKADILRILSEPE